MITFRTRKFRTRDTRCRAGRETIADSTRARRGMIMTVAMLSSRRRESVAVAIVMLTLTMLACGCSGQSTNEQPPSDLELPVAFGLKRDSQALADTAMARATPGDPAFRTWLSPTNIADAYGASATIAEETLTRLAAVGFDGAIDPTRGLIVGALSVAEARALLGVDFVATADPDVGYVVRPRTAPKVPREFQEYVTSIVGLTSAIPAEAIASPATGDSAAGYSPSAPNNVACPTTKAIIAPLRDYYGLTSLATAGAAGSRVRLALLQIDQTSQRALDVARTCFDVDIPPVTSVAVDSSDAAVFGATAEESTLDIVAASLIAPSLAGITTYRFNPYSAIVFPLAKAVSDSQQPGGAHVISTSIGFCEPQLSAADIELAEWVLASAAAMGVTTVASAGDTGSSACAPGDTTQASQYPASSPFVTAIGGTQFTGPTSQPTGEVVWNESPRAVQAGGGATTSTLPRPTYQAQLSMPGGRIVPDVAFVAAPATFGPIAVCTNDGQCQLKIVGGTSATAPGIAGAIAEMMNAAAGPGQPPVQLGLLNPVLYRLAGNPSTEGVVNDITGGTNDLYNVGCCTAEPGFDAASGWGSVNFERLLPLLGGA